MDIIDFLKITGIVALVNAALGWWIKNSIDHKYSKALELFKTRNQLGTDKIQDVVAKCDKWWGEKCLYLEPEAREAFLKAWATARILEHLSQSLVTEAHKSINDAGAVIERSVALPPLNEFEITRKKA